MGKTSVQLRARTLSTWGGLRERRPVENPRGFVADLLKHTTNRAILFGDAFLTRRVRGLADARDERERTVERADDVANADLVRWATELVAAVRSFAAVDEAAMLQRDQNILEELLRDRFLFGKVADEHRSASVLACEQDHRLESVLAFARQHRKMHKVY